MISSAKSDGPGIEDLSEDGELSPAMSEDDPDLAPREWSQTDNAAAAAQRPPPPPNPPKALPAKMECSDAERAQVEVPSSFVDPVQDPGIRCPYSRRVSSGL